MPAKRRLADRLETLQVELMVAAIGNHFFAGQQPPVIGAALAELMSIFLLNHQCPSDRAKQKALREEILTDWCAHVRGLVALETDPPASETLQ
jgi:hypothetical protein